MAEEYLNLYQKLAKIRRGTEVIQKNKAGYGYKYTSIEEILSHVTAGMNKWHVSLVPSFVPDGTDVSLYTYTKIKTLKNGDRVEEPVTEFQASSKMTYTWVNDDNPEERIDVPWFISGSQTDPSQAMGSAMTYGMRYFLTNYFQISTPEDDPDNWRSKQKEAEAADGRDTAKAIIEEFDVLLKTYLADNPSQKDEVGNFVQRFVKNKDYFRIVEPTLAAKLLSDFKETFISKEEK